MQSEKNIFERLYSIGKRLTSSLDTEEVLYSILECAVQEVDGELGWISLVEDGRFLKIVTSYGIESECLPGRISFSRGITGLVAQTGELYYSPDVTKEERFIKVSDTVMSEVAVPLIISGTVLGVFNIESPRRDAFNEKQLQLISALAEQAAIAVRNAEQYGKIDAELKCSMEKLEEKVQALKMLSEVVSCINSSIDLDTVLRTIIEKVKEVTQGAECQLLIRNADTGRFSIHTPFDLEGGLSEGADVDADRGITGWVIKHKKVLNIPDVTRDRRYRCWIPSTRSEIAIPLLNDTDLIGVLNIESPHTHAFDRDMVEILRMLAAHAASAVYNAELFEKYRKTRESLEFSNHMASMGEFTADLIHWFGNKSGLILGCAENISAESEGNPSIEEDICIIKKHMSEVADMKKRILGKDEEEETAAADVSNIVRDCIADAASPLVETGKLESSLACTVKPRALKKAINEIIENGIEAVRDSEDGRVTVSAFRRGARICIRVSDTGPGFPREKLPVLFRPFFTTKKERHGTGMGLWLCYRALKSMNGRIEAEGDSGEGLTFTILLGSLHAEE